jgi:hypothetical protein
MVVTDTAMASVCAMQIVTSSVPKTPKSRLRVYIRRITLAVERLTKIMAKELIRAVCDSLPRAASFDAIFSTMTEECIKISETARYGIWSLPPDTNQARGGAACYIPATSLHSLSIFPTHLECGVKARLLATTHPVMFRSIPV